MRERRPETNSAARNASRTLADVLKRPALARLLEPTFWALGLLLALERAPAREEPALLAVAAAFLVLRLVTDTALNLAAAPRLQEAAYDERRIRRALAHAKLVLAFAAALATRLVVAALAPDDARGSALLRIAGGPAQLLLGVAAVLASYAVATPVVLRHRGVPIARPNLGPAAGALAFLVLQSWVAAEIGPLGRLAAVLALAGNLLVGGWIRYRAAARRLHSPIFALSDADVRTASHGGPEEAGSLLRAALRLAPFLLFPTLPALFCAFSGRCAAMPALIAAFAAALPPVLFDARRGGPRFDLASIALALALVAAFAFDLAHLRQPVVLETATLLLAFPAAARLLARRRARTVALGLVVLVLARLTLPLFVASRSLPVAEVLFLGLVGAAALSCLRAPAALP